MQMNDDPIDPNKLDQLIQMLEMAVQGTNGKLGWLDDALKTALQEEGYEPMPTPQEKYTPIVNPPITTAVKQGRPFDMEHSKVYTVTVITAKVATKSGYYFTQQCIREMVDALNDKIRSGVIVLVYDSGPDNLKIPFPVEIGFVISAAVGPSHSLELRLRLIELYEGQYADRTWNVYGKGILSDSIGPNTVERYAIESVYRVDDDSGF